MNISNNVDDMLGFDPAVELNAFRDALLQLFEEGGTSPRDVPVTVLASTIMPIDILDTGTDLVVLANMPGVKTDHLTISLKGDSLMLKGDLTPMRNEDSASYLRHERRATAYTRSLTLLLPVDADRAEAHLHDGVLTLILPKSESVPPKTIKITASEVSQSGETSAQAAPHV
jgi:HSP20 family protein